MRRSSLEVAALVVSIFGHAATYAAVPQEASRGSETAGAGPVNRPSEPEPPSLLSLGTLVEEADAIIHGRIIDVQYRMSTPSAAGVPPVPHSFAVYEIQHVLKGRVKGPRFVLRTLGGADGTGNILRPWGIPAYKVGDEDILFVQGNTKLACPLVGCAQGRLRVHKERVYSERGLPLISMSGRTTVFGNNALSVLLLERYPSPSFDALLARPDRAKLLGKHQSATDIAKFRRAYETGAPKFVELFVRPVPKSGNIANLDDIRRTKASIVAGPNIGTDRPAISLAAALGIIARIPKSGRDAAVLESAEIAAKFDFVQPRPRPFHPFLAIVRQPPTQKELDQAEVDAWRANNFNPVIPEE